MIGACGEFVTKEGLIAEIQSLLNHFQDKATETLLDTKMMETLDINALQAIRNGLLARSGNEVANNLKWLHALDEKNKF
ncbi:hypothetical protein BKH46_05200 [Helicobacter sp. 12S02634-8]|nr:hypothetical protein BKH46_05200 [Helicobacter sp. 12S02634-8]